jgi:transposase
MWTAKNRQQYERQGLRYPSNVTDEEWNAVRPYLVAEGGKCSPTPKRMREILNGVLYVLSTGCHYQWRAAAEGPTAAQHTAWLADPLALRRRSRSIAFCAVPRGARTGWQRSQSDRRRC